MPGDKFNSLEAYDNFLQARLAPWSSAHRAALAAAMAERWLHAYQAFSAAEDWGDPAALRQSLDVVWEALGGRAPAPPDWPALSRRVHAVTPYLDDFDANEALCACIMVQYAVDCCTKADNQTPALMAVLSGLEAVQPDLLEDDRLPARAWKRPAIHREISKQLRLIEEIEALPGLEDALQALRLTLADPEIMGEVRPPEKAKAPAGMSNQQAFEMYRNMVQADIRGAARGLDPRTNPQFAVTLYHAAWMGRYHRRKELISGSYGAMADRAALDLLVAKNRARDLAEKGLPAWAPDVRATVDMIYANVWNGLDALSLEAPHGYGPSLRRLWVEAKRGGLSDPDAWESIRAWALHQPEAWQFKGMGGKAAPPFDAAALGERLARRLAWIASGDLEMPWLTEVDGETWQARLNDFPDEPMYSLLAGGVFAGDFHDWPKGWGREEG